jgi:hypothetical protein
MNPETLQKWFRPVEVNSHQADGTASPRPLRRLNDQEWINAAWVIWQDTRRNASHTARPPSKTIRPLSSDRPTGHS